MKHLETEFKWDANTPRAFSKMVAAVKAIPGVRLAATAQNLRILDTYLDDSTDPLSRQKIAFRVRCTDGAWEATFKTKTEIHNGKAVRREETLPLKGVHNLAEALHFLHAKKSWQGLALEGLRPLFRLANRRKVYDVEIKNSVLEMALDSCRIYVAGRIVQMKEIELELKQGTAADLEHLAGQLTDRTGLAYARVSKVKTAAALLSLWGKK